MQSTIKWMIYCTFTFAHHFHYTMLHVACLVPFILSTYNSAPISVFMCVEECTCVCVWVCVCMTGGYIDATPPFACLSLLNISVFVCHVNLLWLPCLLREQCLGSGTVGGSGARATWWLLKRGSIFLTAGHGHRYTEQRWDAEQELAKGTAHNPICSRN